jgi:hypothetical protein
MMMAVTEGYNPTLPHGRINSGYKMSRVWALIDNFIKKMFWFLMLQ